MKLRDAALDLAQAGPTAAKLATGSVAVLASAIWSQMTSLLAVGMAAFFLVDLMLGVLKAIHQGGLDSFKWDRFGRGLTKLVAAALGVVLLTTADLMLHEAGSPNQWMPLTTFGLTAMCWGFCWSGLRNFAYFFPDVGERIEGMLSKRLKGQFMSEEEMTARMEERRGPDPFRPREEPQRKANGHET